jgi:cytochrome c553
MKHLKMTATIILLVSSALVQAEDVIGDAAAGKTKATPCAACHGPDGNSVMPDWPNLAGQGVKYLQGQLAAFKSGDRENALMAPNAATLSEQDMADLAVYFAGQEVKTGQADAKLVDTGRSLFQGGDAERGIPACMACHGPSGAGNPAAAYPALQGQHAAYTATQLKAYKSGERATDEKNVMRDIADKLREADIEAVSSYIQGLH